MFYTFLTAAALFGASLTAVAASSVVEVRSISKPDFNDYEALEGYRHRLYGVYSRCSQAAESRFLARDEIDACSVAFLKIKLSFLNGVTLERYEKMKPSLRATANRKGYDAYRAWLHRQTAGVRVD